MSENKKIEIISGDDKDLNISPVSNDISPLKPDNKKPKILLYQKNRKRIANEWLLFTKIRI